MKSRIFIGLFGLPFFAVGAYMLWSISTDIIEWQDMKSWQPVQAHVMSGGVEEHSGDDSTTYKAYAEYVYTYGGQEYHGSRVAISTMADNIGSFNRDLGERLERAQGGSIEVFVNPAKPDEAIVSRDIRWGMIGFKSIFLVVFGGFGSLMVFGALFGRETKPAAPAQHGGSPWQAREAWRQPEIQSDSRIAVYGAWGFALLWNAVSAPIPFMLRDEIVKKENYPALIGLLFPIVGIGLVVWAIRRTLEWKRFGNTPVTLDPFPGSIGGNVGGTIELNAPYLGTAPFIVTLSCIRSRRGSKNDRRESALWQDTAVAYTEAGLYGTRLIFRFDVPEGQPPSDIDKSGDYIYWRLNVKAEMPGTDLDRDYEIPVFPTAEKSLRISQRAAEESGLATKSMDEASARAILQTRPGLQGEEIFYPMGRNIGPAITGIIVGLCFLGPGIFMTWHEHMWFFGGIFLFFGALIFLCSLYMPINSLRVYKDATGGITSRRCILGLPVKTRYAAVDEVQTVTAESHFSSSTGRKHEKQYTIYANLQGRRRMVLGESFKGQGAAEAAIVLIRQMLGLND